MTKTDFNRSLGRVIAERQADLAEAITNRHYQLKPELHDKYGERGRTKCLQDAQYHLSYLAEAVTASRPSLFADYVSWARVMLAGRGIPESDLVDNLIVMRDSLEKYLPLNEGAVIHDYIDAGLEKVISAASGLPSFISDEDALTSMAGEYLEALLRGDRYTASRLVLDAVESGTPVRDIYLKVFQKVQHEIGRLWQENRLTVAQEHYCTAATQMIMSQLYPHVFTSEKIGRTMVAACVAGDLHEIGVRMVADFFEMEGWDTFYLGANAPAPDILKMIEDRNADLMLISATMTFHIAAVRRLIDSIRSNRATGRIKIMVGGYPFNVEPELWRDVGADAFSANALDAIGVADQLVGSEVR
ncbi:MAG TPA: cobalamin-dependent protein [Pyrinomonadaceae bacterium]|nr:cobalamin-dependent protein [Pyrinomonadaceae bacterium]